MKETETEDKLEGKVIQILSGGGGGFLSSQGGSYDTEVDP